MEESKEKQNKRTASADPLKAYLDSTQEFFDLWMTGYQSTFGKLTQVPIIGPIREKQEKIMKGFPVYVNLYNTWVESNINFQTVFTAAMKKTYEKMIIETKGEITATKYKDFYKIWIETYSETLKEFMRSGHYTVDMGKLMGHFMDFQKYNKDMIEENILKPGNLPTKTDIDEINKELYILRKTSKDLNKMTNEISKILEDKINDNINKKEIQSGLDNLDNKINDISKRIDELSKNIDGLSDQKTTQLDLDKKIAEISKKTKTDIQLDLDKKIIDASKKTKTDIQLDLDKKIIDASKKAKTDIQLDLDKKIIDASKKTKTDIQLDLDKKIIDASKKTKTDIQLDLDKKIIDTSKKTKTEIQSNLDNLDNKISEISKKIDEQQHG